jgi:hypothetical protein
VTIDPIIAAALRVLLALLFAAAVAHKIADFAAFRIVLHDYHLLPLAMVTPATVIVIATEIGLAAALPWPASGSAAPSAAVVLLAIYSVGIAINLLRGRRTLECGCAPSTYRQPLSEWLLLRNAVLIAAALALTLPRAPRALAWLDAITFGGMVAAGSAAWVATQQLLALAPRVAVRGAS